MKFISELLAVASDLIIVMLINVCAMMAFLNGLTIIAAALGLSGLTPIMLIILAPFFLFNVGVTLMLMRVKTKGW